jgi:hypothetical protein
LRSLCERYGTGFILVIPPTLGDSGVGAVMQAGVAQGVPVLVPFRPGKLPIEDYSDEVHLNSSGAAKFTFALAADLRKINGHIAGAKTAPEPPYSSFSQFPKISGPWNSGRIGDRCRADNQIGAATLEIR